MRHSRNREFDEALKLTAEVSHWSELADDPNDPKALMWRSEMLRQAWKEDAPDRVDFLVERAHDRRVLDIGCVAHDVERMKSPLWAHGRIANAARSCLGVDVHDSGVEEMNRLGYQARVHDFASGIGAFDGREFDVIVAGELIEHVGDINMLFRTASKLLTADGELILTSPNPWTPARVRAAQLGYVWENTDHILFAFPSGIAELASRHGLSLSEVRTTAIPSVKGSGWVERIKALRRRVHGRQWMTVGFATGGTRRVVRVGDTAVERWIRPMVWRRRRFMGESLIYVVKRA